MRAKIDFKGLKFKIWIYFVLFAAVIMTLLWLLQTVFMRTYYQTMKSNEIKKIADSIVAEYGKSDFTDMVIKYQFNNGITVRILDSDGNIQNNDQAWGVEPPHGFDDTGSFSQFVQKLSKSANGRVSYETKDDRVKGTVLVYGAVLPSGPSGKYYLYISSQIAPIDATTAVLQSQLVIITVISLVLSLLISMLIASKLSRPITRITESAGKLARGDYEVHFDGGNYTEINQLAATMNYATQELGRTESLRRELIANVSHDLRTPLTMVKMYAELIRDISGNKPEKRNAHAQVIIDESDRLSTLITDMLDLSKIQSGTAALAQDEFDLGEKSATILNRFNALAERSGYIFRLNRDEGAMVVADEKRIEQVIYNLVSNAVNYTGDDKTVTITVTKKAGAARFAVTDTGKGIPPEKINQIWERYYKAKETHKRAVVGTGLGLSIVKSILEAHKAAFGIDSTVGHGSTFWFELPLKQ